MCQLLYDIIGNRTVKTVNTNEIHTYSYNTGNYLTGISYTANNDDFTTNYTYTPTGQIFQKIKTRNTTFTVTSDSYSYNRSGQLIEYTKDNLDAYGSSYNDSLDQMNPTLDATKWIWGYKYNHAGQREQKRLLKSPHGDDGTEQQSFAHNWEYYMNGAFGEELIQYSGFQTVKESDGDIGRRVYLSVNKFNATSDLHIRRDGIKEVYFTDNNGNVRVVIDSNNIIKKYDYKPFGELYWSSDGSHLREGLEGSIFDPESELQMKGVRMYDTETGRFTTPDLLWSAFTSHTPYHYAYNSPMIWSDPSGLAPEKERDREKLLNIEIEEERAECGYEILDRKQNEIKNSSKNQTSNSGSRDGNEGSAPGDLSAGTGRGISNFLSEYTDNTQTAMFSTLLAQHLDVGPTGGPMISPGGGFGGGIDTDYGSNLFGVPDQIGIPWLEVAQGELGVEEIKGEIHTSRIIEYHSTSGNWKDDETPWCGSFMNWIYLQVGINGPTGSAIALNWRKFGQKLGNSSKELVQGATVVVKTTNGHHVTTCVGLVEGENSFWGLGGNQGSTLTNNGVRVQVSKYKFSNIISINYPTGYYPWPFINISPFKPFSGK
ncbi:hypothetical protein MASR1M45_25220 [Candidatus Kapaibacterium sp.]